MWFSISLLILDRDILVLMTRKVMESKWIEASLCKLKGWYQYGHANIIEVFLGHTQVTPTDRICVVFYVYGSTKLNLLISKVVVLI